MPSPTKRRKLESSNKTSPSPRGIEYFFSKQQRQNNTTQQQASQETQVPEQPATGSTDEELARRLQAQFDDEARSVGQDDQEASTQVPIVPEIPVSESKTIDLSPAKSQPVVTETSTSSIRTAPVLSLQSVSTVEDTVSDSITLDESPFAFEPSRYIPDLQAGWAAQGGDASYALLTRCFVLVNGTQSRIKIVDTLVNCLRVIIEADPSSLLPMVILLSILSLISLCYFLNFWVEL